MGFKRSENSKGSEGSKNVYVTLEIQVFDFVFRMIQCS